MWTPVLVTSSTNNIPLAKCKIGRAVGVARSADSRADWTLSGMASKRASAGDGTASGKKAKAALIGRDGISILEKLWKDAWPTNDKDGSRVSAEEAASRLFDDLAFEGSQDGTMKVFMEQSLLTWREDINFLVYCGLSNPPYFD